MFNKVMFLSPLHNIGTSTVASCIAHTLAIRGINTMLCYTDKKNNITEYFGLPDVDAPPSNISIVASSMSETHVPKKTLLEYSHHIESTDNLHILNIGSDTIDTYSSQLLMKLLIQNPPTQVLMIDVSEDPTTEYIQDAIAEVDCIFVVINMTQSCIDYYNNWIGSGLFPVNKVFPIVNYYNENIMPIQKFAEQIHVLPSRTNKLHYNPFITRCMLMKAAYELVPQVEKKDARVAQLSGDLDRLYNTIIDNKESRRFMIDFEDLTAQIKTKLNI